MTDTVVLPQSPLAGLQRGDIIAGKYRLEHELGRGAMGMVWAASHATLGQRVAIKLIADEQARSPEARRRFGLEAKAAARLKSRHAVQVYDDGETPEGVPYIVMEYLEGETLEARLERQHDLGLPEAIRITTHVGRALAKAHARDIVHRDLKSGNVFIARTDDDELGWIAKVLDFGVAKLADMASASTTKTGTLVGTPLFMSPEQIRGASHVDHRADLYSLGMVFYNMVTGLHAFNGPSYSDVLVAICTEPLPDIREKAPWLPEAVADWFQKACARDAVDRFQSADEMIEALRDAAGAQSRLGRASLPEDVNGPSGTILGHAPPHVMNTVNVARADGATSPKDNTLRSSTAPVTPAAPHLEREESVTVRPDRRAAGYFLFALGGVGLALALVLGALVVRYAYRLAVSDGAPAGGTGMEPAVLVTADTPPSAAPAPSVAPPVVAERVPEPPLRTPEAAPQRSSERPRDTAPPPRVVAARPAPASAPSGTPAAANSAREASPDMGF
ncbi:MAG TPA: serine/threonine-protein kinase [Polyangiaceae bacterium]